MTQFTLKLIWQVIIQVLVASHCFVFFLHQRHTWTLNSPARVQYVKDTSKFKPFKNMINSSINKENYRLQLDWQYLLTTHMSITGVLPHQYSPFFSSRAYFFLISSFFYTDKGLRAVTAVKIENQIYYSFDCKSEVEIKVWSMLACYPLRDDDIILSLINPSLSHWSVTCECVLLCPGLSLCRIYAHLIYTVFGQTYLFSYLSLFSPHVSFPLLSRAIAFQNSEGKRDSQMMT